jgi:hypothetical protein
METLETRFQNPYPYLRNQLIIKGIIEKEVDYGATSFIYFKNVSLGSHKCKIPRIHDNINSGL